MSSRLFSKKSYNLLLPLALLAAAAGAYFYLTHRPAGEEPPPDDRIVLSHLHKEDIERIDLKSAGDRLALRKWDEKWVVDYPYPVTLNQARVNDIAYSFSRLYAERVVEEDPADLAPYGLKAPAAIARAVLKDGSSRVFYLGDKTAVGDSYYLQVEGDPKVYTVWRTHGANFLASLDEIRDRRLPPVKPEEVTYFRRSGLNGPVIEITKEDESGGTVEEGEFKLGIWRMQAQAPYARPQWVEGKEFHQMLQGLAMLRIDEFVADHPGDLSRYGLAEPRGELLVRDNENTLHLYFGRAKDDELVYFKTAREDNVYAVEKSKLAFMTVRPFALVEKFVYLVFIDYVDKIIIEGPGEKYILTLDRLPAKKKGEDEQVCCRINRREVEEEAFRKLYQTIIGLRVDAENDRARAQEAQNSEAQVTFFLNTGGRPEINIQYVPYNQDFYAVLREGTADFLIARKQVEKMLAEVKALATAGG